MRQRNPHPPVAHTQVQRRDNRKEWNRLLVQVCLIYNLFQRYLIRLYRTTSQHTTPHHVVPWKSLMVHYVHADIRHKRLHKCKYVRTLMSLISVDLMRLKTFRIFSSSVAATAGVALAAAGLAFHIL